MIIGLIALITALFLGGDGTEAFYVDNLEKGIKKHITDKERKKRILSEVSATEKTVKKYEKLTKSDFKSFTSLFLDKSIPSDSILSFYNGRSELRINYQNQVVEHRLRIYKDITPEEWGLILKDSREVTNKRLSKKKSSDFDNEKLKSKLLKGLEDLDLNKDSRQSITLAMDDLVLSINKFVKDHKELNTVQNDVLAKLTSTKEELLVLTNQDSENRLALLTSLVSFRDKLSTICDDSQFKKLMKSSIETISM